VEGWGRKRGRKGGRVEGKEGTPKVWLTPPMFEILKINLGRTIPGCQYLLKVSAAVYTTTVKQ